MQKLVLGERHISIRLTDFQLLGILLLIIFSIIPHTTIHAQSTDRQPNFAIQPATYNPAVPATRSYIILDAKPGATLSESIRITNVGTLLGSVRVYPVSATTAQTGGISYLAKNDTLRDVALWIKVDKQQLTLAPRQSQIVSFQIAVPASTHPGQHLCAITAENLTFQNGTAKGSVHIRVKNLSTMAVQVNVPGAVVERMAVQGIKAGGSNGYQSLLVNMANTGDMMVAPFGAMSIKDTQGRLLQVLSFKLNIILPDTQIDYPVYMQKQALAAGDYHVSLAMHYGHGKTLSYTTMLTITQDQVNQAFSNGPLQAPTSNSMPLWQIILVALAAIIVLLVGGQKVYSIIAARRRKQTASVMQEEGDKGNQAADSHKKRSKVA